MYRHSILLGYRKGQPVTVTPYGSGKWKRWYIYVGRCCVSDWHTLEDAIRFKPAGLRRNPHNQPRKPKSVPPAVAA